VYAQKKRRSVNLAFGAQVTQPTGQFASVYDGYPAGLAGNLSIPLAQTPFELGGAFAWNSMGSQNEDVNVFIGVDEDGDEISEMGKMRIRSNNYRYQMLGRFRPFAGQFQPYADAVAGLESFITRTDIELTNTGYSEVINSDVKHKDYSLHYGWALGARVQLSPNVYIDGRFEKIEGGIARYVDPETIMADTESGDLSFEVRESRTNKFTYQLGIAFQF
jgi:hypothetical protein